MTQHKTPTARIAEMMQAALYLAKQHGYQNVTREQIAKRIGVTPSLVSHHMGTMPNLRRAIVRHAVVKESLIVVGQAVAACDPHTRRIPDELKRRALASLAG